MPFDKPAASKSLLLLIEFDGYLKDHKLSLHIGQCSTTTKPNQMRCACNRFASNKCIFNKIVFDHQYIE